MTARTRERDLRVTDSGTYWSSLGPTTVTRSMQQGLWEYCEDHIGNFTVVNPLSIIKKTSFYPTLGGTRVSPTTGAKLREFTHFPLGYKPGPTDPRTVFPAWTALTMQDLAWKILAESNPSQPHVSLPQFIGELKDIPQLFKGYWDNLIKPRAFKRKLRETQFLNEAQTLASTNLLARWVLAPMISDINKMFTFVEAVNRRLTDLYNLRDGKTLRKKVRLHRNSTTTGPTSVILHSEGTVINGSRFVTYTEECWGTAQWKMSPDSELPNLGYNRLREAAWGAVTGNTSHEALATAWELTPWSWLIDWFSNVGDIIAATNNTFNLMWSNLALMRKSSAMATYKVTLPLADSWVTFDSNAFHYELFERKERYPVVPFLPFPLPSLPLIDGRKWSILASLACLGALKP